MSKEYKYTMSVSGVYTLTEEDEEAWDKYKEDYADFEDFVATTIIEMHRAWEYDSFNIVEKKND